MVRLHMKAAVYNKYGPPDVVQIEDVEKPIPRDNEVLVRVSATTVCAADWRFRKAEPFFVRLMNGVWRPKKIRILGMEFAGTVESTGKAVTRFAEGDQVFGGTGFKFGAHAEFGGVTVASFLGRGTTIQAGQKVLIYGASGSVGTFAVQVAKHFGAYVTGVCSTANLELVRSLGADEVVDYTREDFSGAGRVYDVVVDTVAKSGFRRSIKSLKRGGFYVQIGYSGLSTMLGSKLGGMWTSITGAAKVIGGVPRDNAGDLSFLKGLLDAGKLRTVIDRRYTLEQIVEAHRYVEAGHKKGNVVIVI
jgi:NADPH:quinone reductase-like Zn-dependent oxidoreductase